VRQTWMWIGAMAVVVAANVRAQALSGFVIDQHDEPVSGAIITVEGTGLVAQSDANGNYRFDEVPRGTHSLSIRRGCEVTAHIGDVRIPRPVRIPFPIRSWRVGCDPDARPALDLPDDELARLVHRALHLVTRDGRQVLVQALLADGAIRLTGEQLPSRLVLPGGTAVTVGAAEAASGNGVAPGTLAGPVDVDICVEMPETDTAIVRLVQSGGPGDDVDLLWAPRALLTLTRDVDAEGGWRTVHQLFCLDEPPPDDAGTG